MRRWLASVGVPELERRIKALERESADLREQRSVLKKALAIFKGSPAMKSGVIGKLAGEHSVRKLCRALGLTRSAYHATKKKKPDRPRAQDNARLGVKMGELFEPSGPRLRQPEIDGGVAPRGGAMRNADGSLGSWPKRGCAPGRSGASDPAPPTVAISAPSRPIAWRSACRRPSGPTRRGRRTSTYIETGEGWLYLAGALEACTRKIVGWAADDARPAGLVARAFERAIAQRKPEAGLRHHSDRGSQHAGDAFRELLRRRGAVASMSRKGNCYDNAKMESFWATLKTELVDGRVFASRAEAKTRAEAKSEIFRCIEVFYNRARLHGALGFHSPVDYERNLN